MLRGLILKKSGANGHFSLNATAGPPHPPFGHLLPGGEKGTVASPQGWRRGAGNRSPSPRDGERDGVRGQRAVVFGEESLKSKANVRLSVSDACEKATNLGSSEGS